MHLIIINYRCDWKTDCNDASDEKVSISKGKVKFKILLNSAYGYPGDISVRANYFFRIADL